MKMDFLFSGVFWGIVLVLFGISIVLNAVFRINIPFFRILIAFFFIYLGITILTGNSEKFKSGKTVIFNKSEISINEAINDYSIIFGEGIIDLRAYELKNKEIKLNILFGHGVIRLNSDLPIAIETNTIFGGTRMPDGSTSAFGTSSYKTKKMTDANSAHLKIKASTIFGSLEIF